MSNIVVSKITIRGTRPFLFNAFGPDTIPLEKQEKQGVAGNNPKEWVKTVLMTEDRQLFIEPSYIFGCLRDGARYTKKGRGSIQPLITATLQVLDEKILFNYFLPTEDKLTNESNEKVYLDIRSVRNPATKGRNVRYRVAVNTGWELTVSIMWDKTIISRSEMEAVCIDAGKLVGVGDGRAIGFGRFEVVSFEYSA